jgi:hypothetical protein
VVEQAAFQTVFQFLQTVGILVGVFYYIMTIRANQRNQELTRKAQEQTLETRQAQLYNNIWNQSMNNPRFQEQFMRFVSLQWSNFEEYIELFPYNDYESENTMALWGIALFFEGLAPLVREGLLDIRYLTGTIGGLLRLYWSKIEPVVDEARELYDDPGAFGQAEYLYNELMKYLEDHPELKT